jgi:hypothetical protein
VLTGALEVTVLVAPGPVSSETAARLHHVGVPGSHEFLEGCSRAADIDEVDGANAKLGADPSPERRLA